MKRADKEPTQVHFGARVIKTTSADEVLDENEIKNWMLGKMRVAMALNGDKRTRIHRVPSPHVFHLVSPNLRIQYPPMLQEKISCCLIS